MQNTKQLIGSNGLVNRRIFTDASLYQQELEQVFGRCWLFLGHETQVPKPNDFVAAYMGEDPVLLCRDSKGKLHAFLNMCRHRGNRICRADAGNAPSFMCTYHGWTFSTDGKLVGVPGYKEAYFEELDRSQWGLVEAGQLDTYKGLVFATWDKNALSLKDYMGDMAWWLDLLVDRREGGTEVLVGAHRWVIDCNWKFGSDNFSGDVYHTTVTHGSIRMAGITRTRVTHYEQDRHTVNPGKGNGYMGAYVGQGYNPSLTMAQPVMAKYWQDTLPELEKRLGEMRAKQGNIGVATMFPNFTWHPGPMVRVWNPRGPLKTEIWSYCIVDKKAPQEVKNAMRRNLTITFGPGGAMEADDMNNWNQCTMSGKSMTAAKYPMNVQMGLGHETKSETPPGVLSPWPSETNQRSFYNRWAEIMAAPSWNDIAKT